MKGFRETSSFLASVAVHSAVLALLFVVLSHSIPKQLFLQQPLILEVSAISETPNSTQTGIHAGARPHFQLKDLGVKYGWQVPAGKFTQTSAMPSRSHGFDLAEDAHDIPFFHYVYTKVNENLFYPAELKVNMIQGAVNAVLVFTEGQFNEDQTRITASSAFLKVTVMRALRKAFREKIPEHLHQLDARIEVSCRFVFQIVEHTDDDTKAALNRVVGTKITFYRTFVHSVLQWRVGPLEGMGPSVGLNVHWLIDKVGDLFSKKAKFDPLDSYRDDPAW